MEAWERGYKHPHTTFSISITIYMDRTSETAYQNTGSSDTHTQIIATNI